jgi:lipopolysaccharide export system protein LptA
MIFLFIGRAPLYWVRFFLSVSLVYSCQSKEIEVVHEDPPLEDFEAHGVSLHVVRQTEKSEIFASEFREFFKDGVSIASGDVRIILRNMEDAITAEFTSDFLQLDHQSGRWFLNGGVEVQMQHDIVIYSDSLIWDIELDQLRIPDNLLIEYPNGREEGVDFQTDLSTQNWQFSDVNGYWISSDVDDSIQVRAGIGHGHFVKGNPQIFYSDVRLKILGMELFGSEAYWETESFLLALSGGVRGRDGETYFGAEQMEVNVQERRFVAKGAVFISRDSVRLSGDGWKEDRFLGATEVWGAPARYLRGLANIQGRRMNFKEQEDVLLIDSMAIFEDTGYYIAAQKMTFDGNQQTLVAKNDVKMQTSNWDGILKGKDLMLNRQDERGLINGDPYLVFPEEDVLFRADSIGFDGVKNQVTGLGSVIFENRSLKVESDKAILSLDGVQITFYEDVKLEENGTENDYSYRMLVDTLSVDLVDGKFIQADLVGNFNGRFDVKSGYIGSMLGSEGTVIFSDGNLGEIELVKDANLIYGRREIGEENRFQGEKIKLFFNNQGLSHVHVDGSAEFFAQSGESNESGGVNHVFADEIDIHFRDGRMDNIVIGPSAQGVYISDDEVKK